MDFTTPCVTGGSSPAKSQRRQLAEVASIATTQSSSEPSILQWLVDRDLMDLE